MRSWKTCFRGGFSNLGEGALVRVWIRVLVLEAEDHRKCPGRQEGPLARHPLRRMKVGHIVGLGEAASGKILQKGH